MNLSSTQKCVNIELNNYEREASFVELTLQYMSLKKSYMNASCTCESASLDVRELKYSGKLMHSVLQIDLLSWMVLLIYA